ncbi:sensor histidine kinase [Mycolicibacterium moriokaense]|nr:sensor histidine kinase [Mycolicibacterium moriokaense]
MSSNPDDAAATGRAGQSVRLSRPRTWTLRIRLVAVVAALGVGLCATIGIGTLVALRHFLITRLDAQVRDTQSRSTTFFEIGPPPFVRVAGPGPWFLDGPGQSAGTLGAVISDADVDDAAVISTSGNRQALDAQAKAQLVGLPKDVTVSVKVRGVGDYRLIAQPIPDKNVVLVSGLPLAGVQQTLMSATWIIGGLSLISLVVAVATGMVIIRRELKPLSRMSLAAQRVAGLPLHEGEVKLPTPIEPVDSAVAHTEVGRLGIALNKMVDRVADGFTARHTSEVRVRRFVADASHELRTPLTSIQGYTEVARRLIAGTAGEPTFRGAEDLAHALDRVHAESLRMSRLVEDMLLLARLDAGRPLDCDDVDLSELVIDAVSDAHVAGPQHRWPLDLPDEPVKVVGDRLRLHQAVANLLSNARVHTPAGTKVLTSLASRGNGSVALTVSDDGPGISDDLLPGVFERFARGDGSRSRAAGSTGLGLAITLAVVRAHGGTIDVASTSQGSAFTVSLPKSMSPGRTKTAD